MRRQVRLRFRPLPQQNVILRRKTRRELERIGARFLLLAEFEGPNLVKSSAVGEHGDVDVMEDTLPLDVHVVRARVGYVVGPSL